MSRDFTLEKYRELCHVLLEKSDIYTVFDYLTKKPDGNSTVLRHDVDRRIGNALRMAHLENEMGIRSSYYFRYPSTFKPEVIRQIYNMGHEVGYHYEVLSRAKGNYEKAIELFQSELGEFRKICEINTICMHGSPLSKYDNRDLWNQFDYHSFGIAGEAFLSFEQNNECVIYLTDTGRTWDGKNSIRDVIRKNSEYSIPLSLKCTDEINVWLKEYPVNTLYLTTHPERWSKSTGEWLLSSCLDFSMNCGKRILMVIRA